MITLYINPPNFDDWESLHALLTDTFAYMHTRIDPPSSMDSLDVRGLRTKSASELMVVATDSKEQLVGCAFGRPRNASLYVGKVAVAESARGQGLARRMIDALNDQAYEHKLSWLEIETRVELTENHEAFARLGFKKSGESSHAGFDDITSIAMRKPVRLKPS